MTGNIESYLAELDLSDAARGRVHEVLSAFRFLNDGIAVDVLFVANRVDSGSGKHSYHDLWGFTDTFLLASRDFMTSGNADISPYKNSLSYLGLSYAGFEFDDDPKEDSRLSVELETGGGHTYSQISAVGSNVGYLVEIVKTLLVPSLRQDMLHSPPP